MNDPDRPVIGITGSRSLASREDRARVFHWLDAALIRWGPVVLVHGAQPKGADGFAAEWAEERGVEQTQFPPKTWTARDLLARNSLIVAASDRIIAFWDGKSTGTLDTMRKAAKAGKPVADVLAKEQGREPWRPTECD